MPQSNPASASNPGAPSRSTSTLSLSSPAVAAGALGVGGAILGGAALWATMRHKKRQHAARLEALAAQDSPHARSDGSSATQGEGQGAASAPDLKNSHKAHGVSQRCEELVADEFMPLHFVEHFTRSSQPELYPNYVSLAIAENKRVQQWLEPYLTSRPGLGVDECSYQNFNGMEHVRQAVANFYGRFAAGRAIDPAGLLMTAGCNLALDSLFYCLADSEEYVLLATPYYAAFEWDLALKGKVRIHPVRTSSEDGFACGVEQYKQALAEARAMGRTVRAVLLCNPHNPLGSIMPREELQALVDWVRSEEGLHLVSDEIYALSSYGHLLDANGDEKPASASESLSPARSPFVSLANLLSDREMGDRFHLCYAFSKDFGLSGFRCGFVYTNNPAVRRAYDTLGMFNGLSTDVQHFFYLLLSDERVLTNYLHNMRAQMARTVAGIRKELRDAGIPSVRSAAGLFLWVDLRAWLSAPTVDAEMALYKRILDATNVNLTPGSSFHSPEAGWFRMCHSAGEEHVVLGAVRSIANFLKQEKQKGATKSE